MISKNMKPHYDREIFRIIGHRANGSSGLSPQVQRMDIWIQLLIFYVFYFLILFFFLPDLVKDSEARYTF